MILGGIVVHIDDARKPRASGDDPVKTIPDGAMRV